MANKQDKNKIIVKVIAGILAGLMILGVSVSIIYTIVFS